MGEIWASLFFSAQTFTTVVMVTSVPLVLTSALSAEALIGLLSLPQVYSLKV
jgi:multisubunit Na+/H+ antiporter MnhG subunit